MKLFVDASALVAILAEESDHEKLAEDLDRAPVRLWSAMSCWETINAMRRLRRGDFDAARDEVEMFTQAKRFELVEVGDDERIGALEAYRIYGRGRHKAKLNMGDCFACAKSAGAKLLYKGDDFTHTDFA